MSEEMKAFELNEEDLDKVTGGKLIGLSSGTYYFTCPFGCGTTINYSVWTEENKNSYLNSNTPIGICGCGANIYFKTPNISLYKIGTDEKEGEIVRY